MSGADIADLVILAVYLPAQIIVCCRVPHYMRTGRWFR